MDQIIPKIIQSLKEFKKIEPDSFFVQNSKQQILFSPQLKPQWDLPFKLAFSLAIVFVVLGITAFSLMMIEEPKSNFSANINNFDARILSAEFNTLPINIQLEELTYNQKINETIASVLKEISENKTSNLNPQILEKEKNKLEEESPYLDNSPSQKIDELLNKIIL